MVWFGRRIVIAFVCALAWPLAAGAGASSALLRLRAGDQVVVRGSRLHCAVSTGSAASSPTTILCGEGSGRPQPGSYALAFADRTVLLLQASATGQPHVLLRKPQPAAPGAAIPPVSHPKPATYLAGPNTLLLVGGTHVV